MNEPDEPLELTPGKCANCDRVDRCWKLFIESLFANSSYQACTALMLRIAVSCRMPALVFTDVGEGVPVGSWQSPEAEKAYKDAERQRDEITTYVLECVQKSPTCLYRERRSPVQSTAEGPPPG